MSLWPLLFHYFTSPGDGGVGSPAAHAKNIDREYAFREADVRLLTTLAGSLSVALENARLFEETRQRNAELALINDIQDGLAKNLQMQAMYDLVGDKIGEIFDVDGVDIERYDREAGLIHFQYTVERGVIGLFGLLLLWYALLRMSPAGSSARALVLAFIFGEIFRETMHYRHLWMFFAIALVSAELERRREPEALCVDGPQAVHVLARVRQITADAVEPGLGGGVLPFEVVRGLVDRVGAHRGGYLVGGEPHRGDGDLRFRQRQPRRGHVIDQSLVHRVEMIETLKAEPVGKRRHQAEAGDEYDGLCGHLEPETGNCGHAIQR